MTVLYDRRVIVRVGRPPPDDFVQRVPDGLEIRDLHVTFKVERDDKPKPNTAEVTISNLSAHSRAGLAGKGFRVVVLAGYADQLSQVFSGDVRYFEHRRLPTGWETKITSGDGERAFAFARISESYDAGTAIRSVVARTIQALQVDPGSALQKAEQLVGEFSAGYAQAGQASAELTRLLEPFGWSWSIQDGRLELLEAGEALPGTGPLISPDTGLVGEPELSAPEKRTQPPILKLRSLLQARLRPGQRFELRSRNRSGWYRAKKVTHQGDTAGRDWYTDVEALQA